MAAHPWRGAKRVPEAGSVHRPPAQLEVVAPLFGCGALTAATMITPPAPGGNFALVIWPPDAITHWDFYETYLDAVNAQAELPVEYRSSIISMARCRTVVTEKQRRAGVAAAIDALIARRRGSVGAR